MSYPIRLATPGKIVYLVNPTQCDEDMLQPGTCCSLDHLDGGSAVIDIGHLVDIDAEALVTDDPPPAD